GLLAQKQERWDACLQHAQRYVQMIDKVAADNPSYMVVRRDTAIARQFVGDAWLGMKRPEEALQAHREALERYQRVLEQDESDVQLQIDVIDAMRIVATVMHALAMEKPEAERPALRDQALGLLRSAREKVEALEASGRAGGHTSRILIGIDEATARWDGAAPA